MSDKSASARQYSTIGCLIILVCTAIVFIVWMSWRILHAPVPPKPKDDSLHRVDSIRKKDSLTRDSLEKDSIAKIAGLQFQDPLKADFSDSMFRFHLTFDSSKVYTGEWLHKIKCIDIYRTLDEKPFQHIFPDLDYGLGEYRPHFITEDMNFDGNVDIRAISGAYVNGCATYLCWLYDPLKKKFIENTELETTFDPEFDPKEKLVYSWKNETYSPFDETKECFSWKNGKLYLEHSEVCFSDPAGSMSTLTMTRRIGGKLVSRSKDYKDAPIDSTGTVKYNWDEMK